MDLSKLTVNYHAMLMQSPDPCVLVDLSKNRSKRFCDALCHAVCLHFRHDCTGTGNDDADRERT